MIIVAKIAHAAQGRVRHVRVGKGANRIILQPGETIEFIDEATGRPVQDAQWTRGAGHSSVVFSSAGATLVVEGEGAAPSEPESAEPAAPESGGSAEPAAADAAPSAPVESGSAGGGNGAMLGLLGGLAAVGVGVAAAGGGGGKSGPSAPTPTAPAKPTGLALAAADDSGASSSDRITNKTSALTITGKAEANSSVELFEGTTSLGKGTANASGDFSIDVALATEGAHNITAKATNATGASVASDALAITIDTVAPGAPTGLALAAADDSGASSSDRLTNVTSGLTITGTAEANSRVELFDGATSLGTAMANGSGAFTLDVALAANSVHNITARATDAAGNVSAASAALAITVDTAAPGAPTGLALAAADDSGVVGDGITNVASGLTISGTAEANSRVELFNGSTSLGTTMANGSGAFTLDVALPAGATHNITARATDAAGNVGPASAALAITVDTAAPGAPTALALAAADDSGVVGDGITNVASGLTISGKAEAGARVELFDGATSLGTVTADASGDFTRDVNLAEGAHNITARATDAAGNVGPASAALAITVDTAAPDAPTVPAVSGGSISAAEAAAGVAVTLGGIEAGASGTAWVSGTAKAGGAALEIPLPVAADGAIALTPDILQKFTDGILSIVARQSDVAGNSSAAGGNTVWLDTAVPTVAITASAESLLSGQTVTVTFTFSEVPTGFAADDVSVTGGTLGALQTTDDPLVFTATLTPTRADAGPVTVTVGNGFTDAAGNAATAGAERSLAYDPGVSGFAVDGYIANALVFRDSNGDGLLSDGEHQTVTDAQGHFANLLGTGNIILMPLYDQDGNSLTRDIALDKVFTGQMVAPDGASVISPLSTLVAAVAGANADAAAIVAAETAVKAALGLPAGLALADYDPIGAADAASKDGDANGVADAVAVQKAAAQVANLLTVVGATAHAAGIEGGETGASAAAASALAAVITSGGGAPVNLVDPAVIETVFDTVAQSAASDVGAKIAAQSAGVSEALANVNAAVAAVDATDATSALGSITAAQIVAQSGVAAQAAQAVADDGNFDASDYNGLALANKLDDAGDEVGRLVPEAPQSQTLGQPQRPEVDDGTRVSASEIGDGAVVTLRYDSSAGVVVGDKLVLYYAEQVVTTVTLTAADIPTAGQTLSIDIPMTREQLGEDGTRSLAARFVSGTNADDMGPMSLPLMLTVDTGAVTPIIPAISDGAIGAAEAAAGVRGQLSGIEAGATTVTLTISGMTATPEAMVPLTLEVPVVNGTFTLAPELLAQFVDGTLSLSAQQIDAAGNVSEVGAGSVVLDRVGDPVTALTATEGPYVTLAEGTNGTTITGATTPGSSVSVTAYSANAVFTRAATVAADGTFTVTLSQADLTALGEGVVRFAAIATDPAGNVGPGTAASAFYYTVNPVVDSSSRIDTEGFRIARELDDEEAIQVSALPGGGFAAHWAVDTDGDGEPDTVGIQRFAADGSKLGAPLLLDGLSPLLAVGEDSSVDTGSLNIAALSDGGYAVAWKLEAENDYRPYNLPAGVHQLSILGKPTQIDVYDAAPGTTFTLVGAGADGTQVTVPLTVTDGRIVITDAMLADFAVAGRQLLVVQTTGPVNFGVEAARLVTYDADTPLQTVSVSANTVANVIPSGTIYTAALAAAGRVESFDIDGFTAAAGGATFQMQLRGIEGAQFDYSSIPGANRLPDGSIAFPVTPDANGVVPVPQTLLDQIGSGDVVIILVGVNLQAGSTLSGTVQVREGTPLPESGVYVQTFGADGHSTGDAVKVDSGASPLASDLDDEEGVQVTALPNGGFTVQWAVDVDGDGEADGIAVQRFGADGAAEGDPVSLQGASPLLINDNGGDGFANAVRVVALDGGGYAVGWSTEVDYSFQTYSITTGAAGVPNAGLFQTTIVGIPSVIQTYGVPGGATYTLSGTGATGTVSVSLTSVGGEIVITDAILANFTVDGRYTLAIQTTPGATIGFAIESRPAYSYDPDGSLDSVSRSVVANAGGVATVSALGRVESFDVEALTAASGKSAAFILQLIGVPPGLSLGGITGASYLPNGAIQITGLTPDADGVIAVPQSLLDQLGDHDAMALLIGRDLAPNSGLSVTMQVREGTPVAGEGVYVQQFGADGQALGDAVQVDGAGYGFPRFNDGGGVTVSPARDGGYAVHWLADRDGDGQGDTVAIQRFDASGAKQGDVVMLQGVAAHAPDLDDLELGDIELLENGGYAISWVQTLPEMFKYVPVTINTPANGTTSQSIGIVGKPDTIWLDGDTSGLSFLLQGTGPNGPTLWQLTPQNGMISITDAILANFTVTDRFTLTITGTGSGLNGVYVSGQIASGYDTGSDLQAVAQSVVAGATGQVALASATGRVEAFDIEGFTATTTFQLLIRTPFDMGTVAPLASAMGAFALPDGSILFNNITPDANGVIAVPQPVLDLLGTSDAQVILLGNNLEPGSSLSASLLVREAIPLSEGVFVQTFGSDGHALDIPVVAAHDSPALGIVGFEPIFGTSGDDVLIGKTGPNFLFGLEGDDTLIGGIGTDVLIGGPGKDIFVLQTNGAGSLALTDVIADFTPGEDLLQLSDGLSYSDLIIEQGAPGSGVDASSTVIRSASGDVLAVMLNTDAQAITQLSFAA